MRRIPRSWLQVATHVGALTPMGLLLVDWFTNDLTANPIQAATLRTGKPALVLLTLSLAITPLNTLFGFKQLIPLRRWLGVYAALYAGVHFLIFVGLDYGFDLELLQEAILEKRFALVGFASGLILLPLTLTSTKGWMRRLGKVWKRLHRLVYLAALLATVHYFWLVKSDVRVPLVYMLIVILLLVLRVPPVRTAASGLRRTLSNRMRALGARNRHQGTSSSL